MNNLEPVCFFVAVCAQIAHILKLKIDFAPVETNSVYFHHVLAGANRGTSSFHCQS